MTPAEYEAYQEEHHAKTGLAASIDQSELVYELRHNPPRVTSTREGTLNSMVELGIEITVEYSQRAWLVVHAPRDTAFIASNEGVFLAPGSTVDLRGYGPLTRNVSTVFPFSRRAALLITDERHATLNHVSTDGATVRAINDGLAEGSAEIYSHSRPLLEDRQTKRPRTHVFLGRGGRTNRTRGNLPALATGLTARRQARRVSGPHAAPHHLDLRSGYAFTILSPTEQLHLHAFFAFTKRPTPVELGAHRAAVTAAEPSLPHRAGKAFARLRPFLTLPPPDSNRVTSAGERRTNRASAPRAVENPSDCYAAHAKRGGYLAHTLQLSVPSNERLDLRLSKMLRRRTGRGSTSFARENRAALRASSRGKPPLTTCFK